jgi:hypothetical protein
LHSGELSLDCEKTSFLDIGTGNGHFLFRLREPYGDDYGDSESDKDNNGNGHEEEANLESSSTKRRFKGKMLGTDYSFKSIEFCQRIAATKSPDPPIEFCHFDIMTSSPSAILSGPNSEGYDVVLDKGTFDAISLSSDVDEQGRRLGEGYKDRIIPLVREGGVFLVTSCNWTEGELRGWFEGPGREEGSEKLEGEEFVFVFVAAVKYRSFRFGGKEGQSVSSVCFRKREERELVGDCPLSSWS